MTSSLSGFQPSVTPEEENLSRSHRRIEGDELVALRTEKGKGKLAERPAPNDQTYHQMDSEYPPANERGAETRRIEENLRQWEIAERQRRKAMRDSFASTTSISLLGNIGRKASLLLSSQSRLDSQDSLGTHAALKSRESLDTVPPDSFAASPAPSSRAVAAFDNNQMDNPSANPNQTQSPFADSQQQNAVFGSSLDLVPTTASDTQIDVNYSILLRRPALISPSARPPIPQPLGLPPPRTPPPLMKSPIYHPSQIVINSITIEHSRTGDIKETRWWHDFLCGCGESSDHESQAGRTNPFE